MTIKIGDLLDYASKQAVICSADYGDRSSMRQDQYIRGKQRKAVYTRFGFMAERPLDLKTDLTVGRFSVTVVGEIDYCVGQYAPTEIWAALGEWLNVWDKL